MVWQMHLVLYLLDVKILTANFYKSDQESLDDFATWLLLVTGSSLISHPYLAFFSSSYFVLFPGCEYILPPSSEFVFKVGHRKESREL